MHSGSRARYFPWLPMDFLHPPISVLKLLPSGLLVNLVGSGVLMIHTPVSYQGSVDALQGGLKPLQCGCDWFKTLTQALKCFCRVLLQNTVYCRGWCACCGVNAAWSRTSGEPYPCKLRSLCNRPLEGHFQGHSDCVYTQV